VQEWTSVRDSTMDIINAMRLDYRQSFNLQYEPQDRRLKDCFTFCVR